MDDKEYIKELEGLVKNYLTKDYTEFFYWDILPQLGNKAQEAYARATGDSTFLYEDEDDLDA